MSRTRLLDRIGDRWMAPIPKERLATLRIVVGLFAWFYVTLRLAHFGDFTRLQDFRPVGVVGLLLESPLSPTATWSLAIATSVAGVAFTLGWRYVATGPVFAALLLWVTSYASSWGMIFHTENLLVLHVIVLALCPAADAWSLDARRRDATEQDDVGERYGWPVRLMCVLTVTTYAIAGYTKLRVSGLEWATSDLLRNYIAYDALRKAELGSTHSPLGAWLASVPWVWQPIAFVSLATELGAPLALLSRRAAIVWVIAAWLFHVGVAALMAIVFVYPITGIAFASFFPVEQLAEKARAKLTAANATRSRA